MTDTLLGTVAEETEVPGEGGEDSVGDAIPPTTAEAGASGSPIAAEPVPVTPDKETTTARTTPTVTPDTLSPASARRANIRAKLRAHEQRLSSMVRQTSNAESSESIIGQMKTVEQNLAKVEEEKSALAQELERLKATTDSDDDFLQEKMSGIQEGFQKQVERIQTLEDENVAKANEIDHLREELVRKLRRIVELEFDLETHDVHFTDYAAEQFKLGEDALAEIKTMAEEQQQNLVADASERSGSSHTSGGKKSLSPRRAQKLISKLLADLDNLEFRYKEEKLQSAASMEKAQHVEEELRTQINVLQSRLGEAGDHSTLLDSSERSGATDAVMGEDWLRKRVETLEAKRALYRQQTRNLEKEMAVAKADSAVEMKRFKGQMQRLELENEAMKSRIRALETDILDNDAESNHYAVIEKKIRDASEEMNRLGAACEIKDRQIATLKQDVSQLRVANVASTGSSGFGNQGEVSSTFTKLDSQLLREDAMKSAISSGTGDQNAVEMAKMQKQLQFAQQALVKKDQELVIERAKAASTAAGLVARVTELTEESKSLKKKQAQESQESVATTDRESAPDSSKTGTTKKKKGRMKLPRFYM